MSPRRRPLRLHPDTLVLLRQLAVGAGLLLLVFVLGAAVWYGTRLESVTITTITVSGGETVEHELVRQRAAEALDGAYAALIPRRFTWLYPRGDVAAAIRAESRIDELWIDRRGRTLAISFSEHIPTALWCADLDARESAECLFLNREGVAFEVAPPLSGSLFLRYRTLEQQPVPGDAPLTRDLFLKTQRLAATLRGEGLTVTHVEIDSAGDVYLQLAGGSELWIALDDDPARVLENLATILESDEFGHLEPGNFRYIDLRFGNKVYVNDEPWPSKKETTATATATSTATSSAAAGE